MNSMTIPVGDVGVQLLSEGDAIVRMTGNNKAWEPTTRRHWPDMMQPELMMVDVGAYTGIYAIASALYGMHVMAFEPHPANFARLKANATLNSVRIEAINAACSNMTGGTWLKLKHPETVISDTGTIENNPMADGIEIKTTRLDDVYFTHRIGLIKMDAEGHELSILRGAVQTITKHKPMLLIECLTPEALTDVVQFVRHCHYRAPVIYDRRNVFYRP